MVAETVFSIVSTMVLALNSSLIKSPFNKRICVIIRQIILYCSIFERYNQPYNNARKFIN